MVGAAALRRCLNAALKRAQDRERVFRKQVGSCWDDAQAAFSLASLLTRLLLFIYIPYILYTIYIYIFICILPSRHCSVFLLISSTPWLWFLMTLICVALTFLLDELHGAPSPNSG